MGDDPEWKKAQLARVSIDIPDAIHDLDKGLKIQAVKIMPIRKIYGDDADDGRCSEFHGRTHMAPINSNLERASLFPVSLLES